MLQDGKYENSQHRVCIIDGIKISGFDELKLKVTNTDFFKGFLYLW